MFKRCPKCVVNTFCTFMLRSVCWRWHFTAQAMNARVTSTPQKPNRQPSIKKHLKVNPVTLNDLQQNVNFAEIFLFTSFSSCQIVTAMETKVVFRYWNWSFSIYYVHTSIMLFWTYRFQHLPRPPPKHRYRPHPLWVVLPRGLPLYTLWRPGIPHQYQNYLCIIVSNII